jgi:hypothetical protein
MAAPLFGFNARCLVPRAVDKHRARGAVAFSQSQSVESQGRPPDLLAGGVGVRRAAPRHSAHTASGKQFQSKP